MKIIVRIPNEEEKILELREDSDSFAVIDALRLFPDGIIVLRNGEVIPEDEPLSDGTILDIMKVGSKG